MLNQSIKKQQAQILIEFTFGLMIVFLIMYSLVKAVRWTGRDYKEMLHEHKDSLKGSPGDMDPNFWDTKDYRGLDSVYNGTSITE